MKTFKECTVTMVPGSKEEEYFYAKILPKLKDQNRIRVRPGAAWGREYDEYVLTLRDWARTVAMMTFGFGKKLKIK